MKRSRCSYEQLSDIARKTDKGSFAEVAKRHAVSEATIYIWRKEFGSMDTDEVRRLKSLE